LPEANAYSLLADVRIDIENLISQYTSLFMANIAGDSDDEYVISELKKIENKLKRLSEHFR